MASGSEIERLIQLLAKLPGLGPRSARRAALVLLKKRDLLLEPLAAAMARSGGGDAILRDLRQSRHRQRLAPSAAIRAAIRICSAWWKMSPISGRWSGPACFAAAIMCWAARCRRWTASRRSGSISAPLLERAKADGVEEVVLAMNATVEGQTTAHYLMDLLGDLKVTRLAHGVPVGGELDYLDEGTLSAAFKARRAL